MVKTQIQLPDELYHRAKQVCEARDISIEDLACEGIESLLTAYDAPPGGGTPWTLPEPRRLGWKGLSDQQLKECAQSTSCEPSSPLKHKS
jgi:hypothetical protein